MTEMVLRSKMKRTGQTAAAETDLRADTDVKVSLISKIAYGMGDVGCNFSWMFVGNFLMIFLYRCIWNQYGSRGGADAVFTFLGRC